MYALIHGNKFKLRLTFIFKGISHRCCSRSSFISNVQNNVKSSKEAQHLISNLLKDELKNEQQGNGDKLSKNLKLSLSQQRGKSLKIICNPQKTSQIQITANDLRDLQRDTNISNVQLRTFSKFVRDKTKSRSIIEPYAYEKNISMSHRLDEYFEVSTFDFTTKKKEIEKTKSSSAIICNDLISFIEKVMDERNVYDFHLNFGIDGGGGSLKFTLSVQSKKLYKDENYKRKSIDEFKDTGVKKLFIIALAPKIEENYTNVELIYSKLNLNDCFNNFSSTLTTDLKLTNVITGLTSSSSCCPCPYCEASKDNLHSCGVLRTLENCLFNYNDWKSNGCVKKNIKNFKNCQHPPLLQVENDNELILYLMPPPELHLLLGCVNKLYSSMQILYSDIAEKWRKDCNVVKSYTNGGKFSFAGNACSSLLDNVDNLRRICEHGGLSRCMEFVDTFYKFKIVVDDCFSLKLRPDFEQHISEFKKSYELLNISITPKVHIIMHHVGPFCEKHQMGLGFFAEQATESSHHDFNENWKHFKVGEENDKYWDKLLRAVLKYNTTHL